MRRILVPCLVLLLNHSFAQTLKPGFDKKEYEALMHVSAQFGDSAYASTLPPPAGYYLDYRSAEVGLKNKWELWTSDLGIPVISIRGTTQEDILTILRKDLEIFFISQKGNDISCAYVFIACGIFRLNVSWKQFLY